MNAGKTICLAAALAVAVPAASHAVTTTGGLAPFADVIASADEPIGVSKVPAQFNADFVDADDAGMFKFDFFNDLSTAVNFVASITVNQLNGLTFADGITSSLGGQSQFTPASQDDDVVFAELLQPGDSTSVAFEFSDPLGETGGFNPVGPDIDLIVDAQVIPVPAALPLLAGGLGLLGFAARRRKSA